ncbi:MAG: hypothetical protein CO175_02110 [Verrucomicrobia bacterium CG_4_9_14_3_um_filter_43_20]|nr:MAG: hypothetical protein CO175_02110 [Verrucomicrobia bacterium CG_4_9_14_3_um_filter_43_20]
MKTKNVSGVTFKQDIEDSWIATRDADDGAIEVLQVFLSKSDQGIWVWSAHIDGGKYGLLNGRSISFDVEGDSISLGGAMKAATEAFGKWKSDLNYLASL